MMMTMMTQANDALTFPAAAPARPMRAVAPAAEAAADAAADAAPAAKPAVAKGTAAAAPAPTTLPAARKVPVAPYFRADKVLRCSVSSRTAAAAEHAAAGSWRRTLKKKMKFAGG